MLPKGSARGIASEEEDVAFLDAEPPQLSEAGVHQMPAQTPPTLRLLDRQVMQIAAPPVVAAEHGADDLALGPRHEAQARIPREVGFDRGARVGFVQADTLGALPEAQHGVVVRNPHGRDFETHAEGAGPGSAEDEIHLEHFVV